MRHVLTPIMEDREGEWIIAAARTVIDSVFAEKRLTDDATKKAWKSPWPKSEPFKASKVL